MQYTEAKQGRIFILRLEQGEILHTVVEEFAAGQGIRRAVLTALGGADRESKLIVGPEDSRARPVTPVVRTLDDVREVVGSGTIFPDQQGSPVLHMHLACGRERNTVTGCVRRGVPVWQILEVVLQELVDCGGERRQDPDLGLGVLDLS